MNYIQNLLLALVGDQKRDDCKLDQLLKENQTIMAGIADIQTLVNQEKADLVTMSSLITQLLTAFANETLTPADAQALVDELTSNDTTVKGAISSIQNALTPPAPATPAPTPVPPSGGTT